MLASYAVILMDFRGTVSVQYNGGIVVTMGTPLILMKSRKTNVKEVVIKTFESVI